MKTYLYLLLFGSLTCFGQSTKDERTFEVNTSGLKSLRLYNLEGPVRVTGIEGNVAKLKVKRQLSSASAQRLAQAMKEIFYDSLTSDGNLYFFMASPDRQFRIDADGNGKYRWDSNENDRDRFEVEFSFDVTLEVPKDLDLHVSNHHDVLEIKNVDGNLYARNHHKDLIANNIGGNVMLKNHHGDIVATFTRNPTDDCTFRTHHGDIRITYQENLSADVTLSSRHGEFFTSFDWLPTTLPIKKENSEDGTRYIAEGGASIRIGSGGPLHEFRTWHGDIILERN